MAKSTRKRPGGKAVRPPKPYADFPLGASTNGYWQKRIGGKLFYFGRWGKVVGGKLERLPGDGWKEALELYKAQADDLHAGRTPRVRARRGGLTVRELCNQFLTAKKQLLDTGEIAPRTFAEYRQTTDRLIQAFGMDRLVDDLAADDFQGLRAGIAETRGPVALGNEIQRVRSVFKLAFDNGLIDKPIRYGQGFNKPSRKVLRKTKAANGKRFFEAAEIRTLLDASPPQLRAMILLGINAGFGNADCGTLPMRAVDLDGGWISYARPKTGIERRCPLWPETGVALRSAIADRPKPKNKSHADLVFVTKYGTPWAKDTPDNPVTKETRKLLDRLGLHRKGLGFYGLRHSFRTVADATRDFPAIDLIMGHADNSMAGTYREGIDDSRLVAVVEHVRAWLFPARDTDTPGKKTRKISDPSDPATPPGVATLAAPGSEGSEGSQNTRKVLEGRGG